MEKLADLKSGRPRYLAEAGLSISLYVRTVGLLYVRSHVLYLVVPRFMLLVFRT